MADKSKQIYNKYRLLDAATGEEKVGKYFVLRIDSPNPGEMIAVANGLLAYAKTLEDLGRIEYAENLRKYLRENLSHEEGVAIAADPDKADSDVSKTPPTPPSITIQNNCPIGFSTPETCGYCTPKGACTRTVLTSIPPQYDICPYRGSGYIFCKDAY